MRFDDAGLQASLDSWRDIPDVLERARADNVWFEERTSDARRAKFETLDDPDIPSDLGHRQIWYWKNFVRSGYPLPDTFVSELEPAALGPGPLEPFQPIIRIEDLRSPLLAYGLDSEQFNAAFADSAQTALVDKFIASWNLSRDGRPVFAAWEDQVLSELEDDNWADRLRDRLGLAHYDPGNGPPIPIALMKYTVDDVIKEAASLGVPTAFTAPTVLDCEPWPYFFPAPRELPFGRAMALYHLDDDGHLLAELLHVRLTYKRQHLARVGLIQRRPEPFNLKELRNHHLFVLQVASGREKFGEEIP